MTQAFNLSQLANGVNTSGQVNASSYLYNQVPVANGGTALSSAGAAGNMLLATSASAYASVTMPTFGFRNRIINGAMMIDQRNAGASVTSGYVVDRWFTQLSQSSKFTFQQNAGSVLPPAGFTKYLGATVSSAYSIGAGDYFILEHRVEGFNSADLSWGTASASSVTISFWVRSSLTGTFSGALRNGSYNRSYPFTYTISAANTWEQKSVTIAGDTSGTWNTDNSVGIDVIFSLGSGSSVSGTAGAWAGASYLGATGATSVVGTSGATFYITGVQLEKGSTATSFDYRPYGTELALCQRYFQVLGAFLGTGASTTTASFPVQYAVQMRTSPSFSTTGVLTVTDGHTSDPVQSSANIAIITGTRVNQFGANISASNYTGLVQDRPYLLICGSTGGTTYSNITASAEL